MLSSEHICTEDARLPRDGRVGKTESSSAKQLEPKWHRSVGYCCNFLCAKHGYKQITRHPISILLLSSVTAQVNLSHFTSLTLVAKRTQNEYLEAKAPPMSSFAVVPMSVRERLIHDIVKHMPKGHGATCFAHP